MEDALRDFRRSLDASSLDAGVRSQAYADVAHAIAHLDEQGRHVSHFGGSTFVASREIKSDRYHITIRACFGARKGLLARLREMILRR